MNLSIITVNTHNTLCLIKFIMKRKPANLSSSKTEQSVLKFLAKSPPQSHISRRHIL